MGSQQFPLPPGATAVDPTPSAPTQTGSSQQFPLPPGATPIGSGSSFSAAAGPSAMTPAGAPTAAPEGSFLGDIQAGAQEGFQKYVEKPARGIVQSVTNLVTHPVDTTVSEYNRVASKTPTAVAVSGANEVAHVVNAYETARRGGASPRDAAKAAVTQAIDQTQIKQKVDQAVADFKKNPTKETTSALVGVASIAAQIYAGGAASGGEEIAASEGEEVAANDLASGTGEAAQEAGPAAEKPSLISRAKTTYQQIHHGEDVAQPEVDKAIREAVGPGSAAAEDDPILQRFVQNNPSLRTLVEEPLHFHEQAASGLYKEIDEAAGVDFKGLNDKLTSAIDRERLTAPGSLEEAKEQQTIHSIQDTIANARQTAIDNGVHPDTMDQADAHYKQYKALQDVDKQVFKNQNVIEGNVNQGQPEKVKVDAAIKELQKLQDNTDYGSSRLEQAFGKEGADILMRALRAAKAKGAQALSVQQTANLIGKVFGIGGGGGLTFWGAKKIVDWVTK